MVFMPVTKDNYALVSSSLQFLIVVVDSTDRERLAVTKAELYNMLLQVVWKNIRFLMWDIGGQESLRSAWNTYYTNTEVLFSKCIKGKEQ